MEHRTLLDDVSAGIAEERKKVEEPETYYSGFESLFGKMVKIGEQKSVPRKKPKDVDEFIKRKSGQRGFPNQIGKRQNE